MCWWRLLLSCWIKAALEFAVVSQPLDYAVALPYRLAIIRLEATRHTDQVYFAKQTSFGVMIDL